MKRAKAERWEETGRREVGVSAHMVPRVGAVLTIVYEVTEVRRDANGEPAQWRHRVALGASLYQGRQQRVADAALIEVVAKGVEALAHIARHEDDRVSAAKRATSRRKAR